MISIFVQNVPLDIAADARLTFERNNPLFSDDKIFDGTYTFPITIESTPKNLKLLGFPTLPANDSFKNRIVNCDLYVDELFIYGVSLLIHTAKTDGIDCSIVNSVEDLKASIEGNLKDMSWEDIELSTDVFPYMCLVMYSNAHGNLSIDGTFIGPISTGAIIAQYTDIVTKINAKYAITGAFAYHDNESVVIIKDGDGYTSTLNVVISGADKVAILKKGTILPPEKLNTHMLTTLPNNATSGHVFFPLYNPEAVSEAASHFVNNYNFLGSVFSFSAYNDVKDTIMSLGFDRALNPVVPFVYLNAVLKQISLKLGYSISYDGFTDAEWSKLCLYNNYSLERKTGATKFPTYKTTLNYGNHMPDMSIRDFLLELKNLLNWSFDVDPFNKNIRILFNETVINKKTAIDITGICADTDEISVSDERKFILKYAGDSGDTLLKDFKDEDLSLRVIKTDVNTLDDIKSLGIALVQVDDANDLRLVKGLNQYVVYDITKYNYEYLGGNVIFETGNYTFYNHNLFSKRTSADATVEIKTAFTPVCTTIIPYSEANVDYRNTAMPGVFQKLSSDVYGTEDSSFNPRLVFYRGMRDASFEFPGTSMIPYACSHYNEPFGSRAFDRTLIYNATDGLYDRNWKNWLQTRGIDKSNVKTAEISNAEALNIDFFEKYHIAGSGYFISKITFDAPDTGVAILDLIHA